MRSEGPHDALIHDIARRCAGLQLPPLPAGERAPADSLRANWKRWLRFGGGNDWRVLRRRMRAEGFRPSSLAQPRAVAQLPPWCGLLREIMDAATAAHGAAEEPGTGLAALARPAVAVARARLAHARAGGLDVLSPEALADLTQALAERLAQIAGPVVVTLFEQFRAGRGAAAPSPAAALLPGEGAPTVHWQAFVAELHAGGLAPLFTRWPVLARLWCVAIGHWIDMVLEFSQRAAADRAALAQLFDAPAAAQGRVERVGITLSDAHGGGRTVMKAVFSGGLTLAYKPRPTDMEAGFSTVLEWLNAHLAEAGIGHAHRVPRVLSRPDYGWMEWITPAPMAGGQEPAYHWRLGSLIGLYRALGGIDLHLENAVAAADCPVLIDLECLFHPSAQPFLEAAPAQEAVDDANAAALLNMAALPIYGFGSDGRIYSFGLFGTGKPQGGPDRLEVVHAGTDWMTLARRPHPVPAHQLAHTAGGPVNSLVHADAAGRGYAQTLALVLAHREEWLADGAGPLAPWRHAVGRVLLRTSGHYGALLGEALLPAGMADGVAFDLTFEPLHRHVGVQAPAFRAIAPRERADLAALDVPRFSFRIDGRQLLDALGRPLGEFLPESPAARVARMLRRLTPQQVDWEARVLAHALRLPAHDAGEVAHLARLRLQAPDGATRWLGLGTGPDGTRVKPLGPGLYEGQTGLAFALAAAASTGAAADADLHRLAVDALEQVCADLDRLCDAPHPAAFELLGPGMDVGLGGILYGLQAVPRLLGDATQADRARRLAARLVADPRLLRMVAADKRSDLLNGVAGLLLALLSWHAEVDAAQAPVFLDAALACGRRVMALSQAVAHVPGGGLGWPQHGMVGLSGLSHGAAGFALALGALARASGDASWLEPARAALRYEASLYDGERLNWRDMRRYRGGDVAAVRYYGMGWCHGAPGIALGRAALLRLWPDADADADLLARLRQDLEVAVGATLRALDLPDDPGRVDDLCCGTAGRIDIVLEAGRLAGRADWVVAAQDHVARRVARWQGEGARAPTYWHHTLVLGGSDLGLFKGQAGWPYLRARTADPVRVPSVLLPTLAFASA